MKRRSHHNRSASAPPAENPKAQTNRSSIRRYWARLQAILAEPVSGASLGFLRISMGLLMMLEAWSLCRPNPSAISMGTSPIATYYAGSSFTFNFPYPGFEWLPLLPTHWMYALAGLQAMAGLSMALGFRSRTSSAIVFLTWAYFFVVESTRSYWQSHYYLELLFTFLLVWMPTGRRLSIDAWLARRRNQPGVRTVPFWTVFLLRGQLVIAYFYAGVAKLSTDWLVDAVPVRWFLNDPTVTKPYASWLSAGQLKLLQTLLHSDWFAYFISYTGLVFDLVVGFLFLFRRSRMFAMLLMLIFHATNHLLIFDDIDWFPLAGVTTALIFLDTDWPERFWVWLKKPRFGKPDWSWLIGGAIVFPVVGAVLGWRVKEQALPAKEATERHHPNVWTKRFVVVWLGWQTLLPIRHYFIPGDGRFTYEGLSFSWRLKSDRRSARGAILMVRDPQILSITNARPRIDWSKWQGDHAIFRRVIPGRIDWRQLPELAVVLQPVAGERVLYNPYAVTAPAIPAEMMSDHVRDLWIRLYSHPPASLHETITLANFCEQTATALKQVDDTELAEAFTKFVPAADALDNNQLQPGLGGQVRLRLRAMIKHALETKAVQAKVAELSHLLDPFTLAGQPRPTKPFLIIDDPELTTPPTEHGSTVNLSAWKDDPRVTQSTAPRYENVGGRPLIVYTGDIGPEAGSLLPQAYIMDFLEAPQEPPTIYWNSLKDLSPSKSIHISNQAFYLRRYARRVAGLWEKQYGQRPVINAMTAVSLNGRPYQELVDPNADLASVKVKWFGHNAWIRDLQTPRIPRAALQREEPN